MSLKKQATSGLVWTFSQQFGNQIVGFVVSLILARILLPAEFGLIGMIAVLVGLGRVLVHSGMTESLIRSEHCDEEDYSTVFFTNLLFSISIYLITFFTAPYVADFYDQPILIKIIRLYCLSFIMTAFSAVQFARLTKNMNFKTQMLVELPANIVGGVVGIVMAYSGYGVYSLVWSQLVTSFLTTVQLWIHSRWIPTVQFSMSKFKTHFSFGYRMAAVGILGVVFRNAYILTIGKFFTPSQVGFYTRAETMKKLPVHNISTALNKVTFPLFASIQNDDVRLKRVYKQMMQMVVFVIAPVLIFLGVLAEPVFRLLFTEKWLPAVPYFRILCMAGILIPVHSYNLNILKVKGRSDLFLKLRLYEKGLVIISIIIGVQFGIYGILFSQVVVSLLTFFINTYYTDKFINYPALEQIKVITPILGLSMIMGLFIFIVDIFNSDSMDIVRILTGGFLGALFYLGLSWVLKMESFLHLQTLVIKNKKGLK